MELATMRELQERIKDQVWRDNTRQGLSRCQMISLIWPRVLFIVRIHCCTRALLNNLEQHLLASLTKKINIKNKSKIKTSVEQSKVGHQME